MLYSREPGVSASFSHTFTNTKRRLAPAQAKTVNSNSLVASQQLHSKEQFALGHLLKIGLTWVLEEVEIWLKVAAKTFINFMVFQNEDIHFYLVFYKVLTLDINYLCAVAVIWRMALYYRC